MPPEKRVQVAAFMMLAMCALGLAVGFFVYLGRGTLFQVHDTIPTLIMFLAVLPGAAGISTLRDTPSSRRLLQVAAAVMLLVLPVGTIVGAYTFWALYHKPTPKPRPPIMPQVGKPLAPQ